MAALAGTSLGLVRDNSGHVMLAVLRKRSNPIIRQIERWACRPGLDLGTLLPRLMSEGCALTWGYDLDSSHCLWVDAEVMCPECVRSLPCRAHGVRPTQRSLAQMAVQLSIRVPSPCPPWRRA